MPDEFSWATLKLILQEALDEQLKDVAKKQDVTAINSRITELATENENLRMEIKSLQSRLESVDHANRRCNVIVKGLTCKGTESASDEFVKMAKNILKTNVYVVESTKLPQQGSYVFKLSSQEQAIAVLKAKKLLKGTSVFVNKDYTQKESNNKYNLRILAKKVSAIQDLKVRMGSQSIFIADKAYTWTDGKIVAACDNDAEFLRDVLRKIKCNFEVCVSARKRTPRDVNETSTNGRNKSLATSSALYTLELASTSTQASTQVNNTTTKSSRLNAAADSINTIASA